MTKPFFEASFTNLDLSEFDTSSSATTSSSFTSLNARVNNRNLKNDTPSLSAAEKLLLTKEKETNEKQFELQQEEYIQMKAKQRQAEYIMKQQKQKENNDEERSRGGGGGNVVNAFFSMHGNDLFGKQLEKSGTKTKAQRQTLTKKKTGINRNKKGGVVKKARKTKHYKR